MDPELTRAVSGRPSGGRESQQLPAARTVPEFFTQMTADDNGELMTC
jgi:hypothetical protein